MPDDIQILSGATIVPVRDVAASVDFYRDALGFEVRFAAEDGSIAIVGRGPAALQLLKTDDEGALKATSTNIALYIEVKGLDALYESLRSALDALPKARFRPPFEQPYGMREFHVKDPDGCLLFFGEAA
ncbi:MAG: VOC family protein [Pseudomonadota bacterium]